MASQAEQHQLLRKSNNVACYAVRMLANSPKTASLRVVVLLGIVSLFADVVYEGARSITGPYLATFGATGAIVAFISGFAEMLGYVIRAVMAR
jgi:hypothetical protein